jgi:hypothetical protein
MGMSGKSIHTPHIEQHLAIGITVGNADQRAGVNNVDTQFFVQFPAKCSEDILTRLNLAARELPQSPLMQMHGTAGYQDAAIVTDDGRSSHM